MRHSLWLTHIVSYQSCTREWEHLQFSFLHCSVSGIPLNQEATCSVNTEMTLAIWHHICKLWLIWNLAGLKCYWRSSDDYYKYYWEEPPPQSPSLPLCLLWTSQQVLFVKFRLKSWAPVISTHTHFLTVRESAVRHGTAWNSPKMLMQLIEIKVSQHISQVCRRMDRTIYGPSAAAQHGLCPVCRPD